MLKNEDAAILLGQLRALLEREPNWAEFQATSREHHTWLAQAYAIVRRWDEAEAIVLKANTSPVQNRVTRI